MKTNKVKRLFWAVMTMLLPMCAAATPATLSIEDFTISAGQTKEMLIDMNNPSDEITLIQFDLRLPDGLSIATEGGEMLIDIAGRTTWRKHSLNANTLGDITRFLLSSSTNAVISGSSGAVISITLTASDNFNGGTIKLENQLLVTPAAVETKPADYSYTIEGSSPVTGDIPINTTTFPDENFRNWVLAQSYGQDGVLTETEIAGVVSIDVVEKNIASLKGIDYFIALECLYCYNNQLTTLDLSKNTALTKLSCKKNQLSFLDVSKNTALTEFNCSQNQLTSLDVSKNTALTYLDCGSNLLTSLDVTMNTSLNEFRCNANQLTTLNVSKNTALKSFYCTQNQLVSLDVTKLTALVNFGCGYNRLTSLDVTKNAILGRLWCEDNKLTTLDVSKNIALTMLDCCYNQLTTLDVSKNTALKDLYCNNNQLTTLDVSKNTVLNYLACYANNMNVMGMGILVESLPANTGTFRVKNLSSSNEQNVITTTQVAAAKAKGWTVYAYIAGGQWVEYNGDEPTMEPIETADFGSDIDGGTDLDGNVVGDILYNISSGDGSYNATEGCIVVTTPTDDSAINGQDIFGEDFQNNFTGIVFKVPEGKGTVKVEAQTTGAMVLKVKIGSADPVTMELEGRLKVSFPYNVTEPTYVYIYGGAASAAPGLAANAAAAGELKLYGIEVVQGETGISPTLALPQGEGVYYDLSGRRVEHPTKGLYILNGKKVVIK